MNLRMVTAIAASFIFIFIFGWVFHGVLLKDIYAAIEPGLYRPEGGMRDYFLWLLAGQLLLAVALTGLIARGSANEGLRAGATLGFLIGLMSAGSQLITYAVMPIPLELLLWWIPGTLVEMTLIGMLIADLVQES